MFGFGIGSLSLLVFDPAEIPAASHQAKDQEDQYEVDDSPQRRLELLGILHRHDGVHHEAPVLLRDGKRGGLGLRLVAESERLLVVRGDCPVDPAWPRWEAGEQPLPIPGEVNLYAGWRLVITRVEREAMPDFPALAACGSKADKDSRATSGSVASPWEAWLDAAAITQPSA